MRDFLRNTIIVSGLLVGLGAPAHADKTFNIGSLILAPGSAYQHDCGAVAVYGLVYDVLRANAWLEANRATVCPTYPANQTCKIELFYTYKDTKQSPNRCGPTNLDIGAAYPGAVLPMVHTDPKWNDGCDFEIYNGTSTPVQKVATNQVYPWTYNSIVTNNTVGKANVAPQWAAQTIASPAVTTVRYLGGPFIIADTDAGVFARLLSGNLIANDKADGTGNPISFAPFRGNGANPNNLPVDATTCSFGTTIGGYVNIHRSATMFAAPVAKAFTDAPPRVALLATTAGQSTINIDEGIVQDVKNNNNSATDGGLYLQYNLSSVTGLVVGDVVTISGVQNSQYNGTWTISVVNTGSKYIRVTDGTGLARGGSKNGTVTKYTGAVQGGACSVPAVGCTKITFNTSSDHGFTVGTAITVSGVDNPLYNGGYTVATIGPGLRTFTVDSLTPAGLARSGNGDVSNNAITITKKISDGLLQVYLRNGGLEFPGAGGCPTGGLNIGNPLKCPGGDVRGQIYDTFDISDFASGKLDPARYKMVWTPHWETKATATLVPTFGERTALTKIHQFLDGQTGLMAECHSIEAFEGAFNNGTAQEKGYLLGQFQTCVAAVGSTFAAPVCVAAPLTYGFGVNKNVPNPATGGFWPNCSDPTLLAGASCTYFSYPGDPFAQPGDFMWKNIGGSVQNYTTVPGALATTYKPGVLPLISGVLSLQPALLTSPVAARGMISTEYASRSIKDNTPGKANILYMAGHDVRGVVSGTKVILQTLLLLGDPPIVTTIEEVSRASPIIVAIGGVTAIVQGSFEQLTPPGSTITVDSDAQIAGFRFPDLQGHMRAVDTTTVNAQTPIKDLVEVFDAATIMADATNSYTGCGANGFGAGTGNCRTVFTHTDTGMGPARVVFESASAANVPLKTAINLGGGTLSTAFPTFLQRIIAGDDSSGTYLPKLGGVDRSTVAVIPSSTVVPGAGTRPTMIYFGATDGMLHAVCGSLTLPAGTPPCDVLGRELWAYVPKRQLPYLRKNTARVDGSVRVLDVFADLDGAGPDPKSFKTLLVFQTTNGDPVTPGKEPSMNALDVSDPTDPKIAWDYPLPGQGLVVNVGRVTVGGANKYLAFAQTNAGTGASGNVVTAVDVETGLPVWTSGGPTVGAPYLFTPGTPPSRLAGTVPPVTGIPGGAVGVDTRGAGNVTDVVFGTLYGDIWQLDAATGVNRQGAVPLFQYATDQHPIGAPLSIFGDGSLYALAAPGGYADLAASTLWSAANQTAVAVRLFPALPVSVTLPLSETSGPPGVKWTFAMAAGDKVYSQPVVSGGDAYISAESLDANQLAYGSITADTGRVYRVPLAPPCTDTAPADGICDNAPAMVAGDVLSAVVAGGVSSVVIYGGEVFAVGKNAAQKLGASDATAGGTAGTSMNTDGTTTVAVSTGSVPRVTRKMWLRTL